MDMLILEIALFIDTEHSAVSLNSSKKYYSVTRNRHHVIRSHGLCTAIILHPDDVMFLEAEEVARITSCEDHNTKWLDQM